jgi:predicted unusual protein kinase regulating ubiquinone biosynthesis (AarF/ABC1/UbiB family)
MIDMCTARASASTSARASFAKASRAAQIARFAWRVSRDYETIGRGGPGAGAAAERLVRDTATEGALFVKMAQFVSARSDALDPATVAALERLQDAVPCDTVPPVMPGYAVDPVPIASASIASVFKAVSPAGETVAIKVVRAGVRAGVDRDFPLLVDVLRTARALNVAGAANMLEIVTECQPMIRAELDLRGEAKAQEAIRRRLAGVEWVRVPRVREAGEGYMVSDFVASRKITAVRPSKVLAERLFELYVRMILDVGLVHADPHAGNVGVLPDGTFVLYDFGAVIDVRDARPGIAALMRSAVTGDVDSGVRALTGMGVIKSDASTAKRIRRAMPALRALASSPNVNADLATLPEFADNDRRMFELTTRYVYLIRSLVIVQGLIAFHDPDFALDQYAARYEGLIGSLADAPLWDVARGWLADVLAAPASVRGVQTLMDDVAEAVEEVRARQDRRERIEGTTWGWVAALAVLVACVK